MPSKRKSKSTDQSKKLEDSQGQRARALRLHEQIAAIENRGVETGAAGPDESPAAFVRRRMAEEAAKAKKRSR
jgi:hypothetical protein